MNLLGGAILFLYVCTHTDLFADATLKTLRYFERLHTSDLSHSIVKRGLQPSPNKFNTIKQLSFKTLGRDFRLMLTPGVQVLSSQFRAYSVDGRGKKEVVPVDHDNFYEGRVFGEINSHANVHYEDGLLTATIHTSDDTYVIEPSWRHLGEDDNQTMIAYRGSDILPTDEKTKVCGYVKVDGNGSDVESEREDNQRVKRQSSGYSFESSRSRCPLLLVADYRFYQSMGGRSKKSTINYLVIAIVKVAVILFFKYT